MGTSTWEGGGLEVKKKQQTILLIRGPIPNTSPIGNRVNSTSTPMGNRVNFYFKCYIRSILLISNALSSVENCQYTCPGGWVAQAMWWVAQAMWSGLRRLCGGSDSDYNTNLSSTSTELANWN